MPARDIGFHARLHQGDSCEDLHQDDSREDERQRSPQRLETVDQAFQSSAGLVLTKWSFSAECQRCLLLVGIWLMHVRRA